MTDPVFYGEMAHALGGYAILLTIAFFSRSWKDMTIGWFILLLLTAVKEFYYDTHFEIPVQDLKGGLRDFLSYQAGAALAMFLGHLKLYFKNK